MTGAFYDTLASSILAFPSYQDGIAPNPNSPLFTDLGNGIYRCENGFDARYELPHSKNGKYVNQIDLRNIYNVGIEHGKQKVLGWKNRWNKNYCSAIGGYPKGSIIYLDSGIRMVSREGNNMKPPPEDGNSDKYWVRLDAVPSFGSGFDVWSSIGLDAGVELPTKPTTTNMLISTIKPTESVLFIFTYMIFFWTQKGNGVAIDIGQQGHMSMKLSPYNDIYTNPLHKDEYIEVLSCTTYKFKDRPMSNSTWPIKIRSPHKAVALMAGKTYYLFIEYNEGCMVDFSSIYKDDNLIGSGSICGYSTYRRLTHTRL